MTNRNRPFAAVVVAATLSLTVAAAATSQGTAATPAESRYTLVDVGGKALPVETEKEWRCREEVTTGTLIMREDSRWRLETNVRETCGDSTRMDQEDEDGRYRTEGTTIHFLDDDGNRNDSDWSIEREIDLEELDHGTVEGGTLTVRLADEKTVLRFRREAP